MLVLLSFVLGTFVLGTGLDAYDRHHARVLVTENVAMKDEIADIRPAEGEAKLDAGVRMIGVLVPERNQDRIQILAGDGRRLLGTVDLEVVLRLHQEVNLMD